MKLIIASNNSHKIFEFKSIILGRYNLLTPKEVSIEFDVEETGTTFEENAILKSEHLYSICKEPCIADDSGLVVEALNGEPGVYSARFGKKEFNDRDRAMYLLECMNGKENRNAYYRAVISYTDKNGTKLFSANSYGLIQNDYDETGNGFGYDPIFYHPILKKRFSQASVEEKNLVSHRSLALQEFLKS